MNLTQNRVKGHSQKQSKGPKLFILPYVKHFIFPLAACVYSGFLSRPETRSDLDGLEFLRQDARHTLGETKLYIFSLLFSQSAKKYLVYFFQTHFTPIQKILV